MLAQFRRAAALVVICLVLFGIAYPLLGVGLSGVFFKGQAEGSIGPNGSSLIGQDWSNTNCPGHPLGSCVFQGRPDNLGPYSDVGRYKGDNPVGHGGDDPLVANGAAGGSGATNLGPKSKELGNYTQDLIAYWHARGVTPTEDLVTTSGSGLDPDITPADAIAQIPMVSAATGISSSSLRNLINQQTRGAEWGFLGSPYIIVLSLNEALHRAER